MFPKKIIIVVLALVISFLSCDRYDDYIHDFDYSAVYFATQRPLRTIVARDVMQFKFGVAVGGLRELNTEHWAKFVIDTTLLSIVPGASALKLLPEAYYSLSNSDTFIIEPGRVIGDVTVSLNRDLFTADPLAHLNTYALPVRITETSLDSLGIGGESLYSIIVVKYMSAYGGSYYHKGVERRLGDGGALVQEVVFRNNDLSQNIVKNTSTLAVNSILTQGISSTRTGGLKLTVNNDNSVAVDYVGTGVVFDSGSGSYDAAKKSFYLNYRFSAGGNHYHVVDTLILRQDPEKDLRFEQW
jgi:hypothetical protein